MTSPPLIDPKLAATLRANTALAPPPVPTTLPTMAMPSPMPQMGNPAPPLVTRLPTQTETDTAKLNAMTTTGSGISQIKNPFGRVALQALDAIGSIYGPTRALEYALPGTNEHHQLLTRQMRATVANDQANDAAASSLQDQQAQVQQRQALAQQETAKAQSLLNPQAKAKPGEIIQGQDGYAAGYRDGDGNILSLHNPQVPQDIRDVAAQMAPKSKSPEQSVFDAGIAQGKTPQDALADVYNAKNVKDATTAQMYANGYRKEHPDASDMDVAQATIRATQIAPKIDVHTAEQPRDVGTWAPGFDKDKNPVLFNTKTGEVKANSSGFTKGTAAGLKLSADEQKRADMAKNLNENIDKIDDISQRRPELFGPIAGRLTNLKTAFGTDDNDISTLSTIQHQLGMVAQSAHSMRSAQGVEASANSLLNHMHNSASATRAALEGARDSVRTFTDDANNPGQSRGPNVPSTNSGVTSKPDFVYVPGKGLVKQ